jgi:dTDP-glucose pyrophosphorylase
MSGKGSRFNNQGYNKPKPLIEFFGKTMIEHVIKNLGYENTYTLCVLRDHFDSDPELFTKLSKIVKSLNIVFVDKVTQGAAETCLLAKNYIDPEKLLFIANCDQIEVEWNQQEFEAWYIKSNLDGCMFTFFKDSPAYSYVEIGNNELAIRTAEKEVISNHATTGIYVWTKAKDFIWAAEKMIRDDIRVNGEFYVCPCYNQNIAIGQKIGIYAKPKHEPIGTPEDLTYFMKTYPNWS